MCFTLFPLPTYPVPPPSLNIELLNDPRSGTVVCLQGRAQINSAAIDTDYQVSRSWNREGSNIIISNISQTSPFYTLLTFNPLRVASKDGGDYVYTVTITPQDSTYIASASSNASYTLTVLPYPELVIKKSMSNHTCVLNETAILTGEVSLLPNTASYTLSYSWRGPDDQSILSPSSDYIILNDNLEVSNVKDHMGSYTLTVCLDIPGSFVEEHCSTVSYTLMTDGKK